MVQASFKALVVERSGDGVAAQLEELTPDALPQGDVLVSVAYSTLNYKDALAVTNQGKILRSFPFVPGIDFSGIVEESQSPLFKPGNRVVLTGWGVGERHWGGYAQKARVKADWLIPLPDGFDLQEAMAVGTAGFTAMLSVMALEDHGLRPSDREVLITGAAGGLGSVAVALLAQLGYRVTASTGRAELHNYLKDLGAAAIIDRSVLTTSSGKPLDSERWAGAIDTVGGETLAGILRSLAYGASVAACGLAGGPALSTTVYPFILRGANLLGIDSVMCPTPRRIQAWKRLTQELSIDKLRKMMQIVPLEDVPALSQQMMRGQVRGRLVVDVNA